MEIGVSTSWVTTAFCPFNKITLSVPLCLMTWGHLAPTRQILFSLLIWGVGFHHTGGPECDCLRRHHSKSAYGHLWGHYSINHVSIKGVNLWEHDSVHHGDHLSSSDFCDSAFVNSHSRGRVKNYWEEVGSRHIHRISSPFCHPIQPPYWLFPNN